MGVKLTAEPRPEQKPDGSWVVVTSCRGCGKQLRMKPSVEEPNSLVLMMARLLVCDECEADA